MNPVVATTILTVLAVGIAAVVVIFAKLAVEAIDAWVMRRRKAKASKEPAPAPPKPPEPERQCEVKTNLTTGKVEFVIPFPQGATGVCGWSAEAARELAQLLLTAAQAIDNKVHPYDASDRGKKLLRAGNAMASRLSSASLISDRALAEDWDGAMGFPRVPSEPPADQVHP